MKPLMTIKAFDKFLSKKAIFFEAIIIGGTALNLLGVISRETRDCDVLDPEIPDEIIKASKEFSKVTPGLDSGWLNNGPESLKKNLPEGWEKRLRPLYKGNSLSLFTLSRSDLIKIKLFACCDRETDRVDCLALNPTEEELRKALPWVQDQDKNPNWPEHVNTVFLDLAKELGIEF